MSEVEKGYRAPQVCRIVGITYRQLDYWARTGFVVPSLRQARGSGTQRLYSFPDLIQLKVIKRLLDAGMDLKRVRRAFAELSEQKETWSWEDGQATLVSDGATIYALKNPEQVIDLLARGQAVMGVALGPLVEEVNGEVLELARTSSIEEGYLNPTERSKAL